MAAHTPLDPEAVQRRMQTVCDLFEAALALQRQNLRRRHPEASEERISELVQEWLFHRPGAEHGDGVGRPIPWPPPRRRGDP